MADPTFKHKCFLTRGISNGESVFTHFMMKGKDKNHARPTIMNAFQKDCSESGNRPDFFTEAVPRRKGMQRDARSIMSARPGGCSREW
mmetsp:Transcript_19642/g.27625  ORF Transcript_19642/g.27625 Transcript_19642/m.27625 type:complete len:88 (-) Transcript_19642:1334-1597(-)